MATITKFKLVFFSPATSTRSILDALFKAHPTTVGKIGEYEQCAFVSRGTGQFKPSASANPTIGKPGGPLEFVEEDRVEVLVNDQGKREQVRDAIQELKKIHPYEEVAYDVYKLEDI